MEASELSAQCLSIMRAQLLRKLPLAELVITYLVASLLQQVQVVTKF